MRPRRLTIAKFHVGEELFTMSEDAIPQLQEARSAFARHDWPRAFTEFNQAARSRAIGADDLRALAESAWWLGRVDEAIAWYERSYSAYLLDGMRRPAALIALMVGFTHMLRAEDAVGAGWLGRAARLLDEEGDCPEQGYLAYVQAEEAIAERRLEDAIAIADVVQRLGRQSKDSNLLALGVMCEGIARIRMGDSRRGSALLDEAMVIAVTEHLDPSWAGNIYCTLMSTCDENGDYRRAAEWTRATNRWCDGLSAPGPFLGVCRMHRARIHRLHGAWDQAECDARRICEELAHFERSCVAEAHYQLGELARLRGRLSDAAKAYEAAREMGRDPQPGYALYLLAGGHPDEAMSSIETALIAEPQGSPARIHLRAAQLDIADALGVMDSARTALAEILEIAAHDNTAGHHALARRAEGTVLLAEDRAAEALSPLREACRLWLSLDAAYDVARTRFLLSRVYDRLGDRATSARELDSALAAFAALGARRDIDLATGRGRSSVEGVTEREAQVLALLARGLTNRQIAQELFISSHTVSRHLENIYAKLSLATRAAAAAWASEHGLGKRQDGSFDPMP